MKTTVVILSMFAIAWCAPTGEQANVLDVDSDDLRVKRAKEIMMFGNEQNDQQRDKAKRADPLENEDKNGYIVAQEPVDIESSEDEESVNADVEQIIDGNQAETNIAENIVEQHEDDEEEEGPEPSSTEESSEVDETVESTAIEPLNSEEDDMSVEDYLNELVKMQDSNNMSPYLSNILKTKDPYYGRYPSYFPYGNYQRYRRSQMRTFNTYQYPRSRVLKRAHRTKRQAYYLPDLEGYLPYDDLYEPSYNEYPVTEDDLAELLDVIDDENMYNDELRTSQYGYEPYDELEFESPIYVPKRQSGLTFVPGLKRNRDFYPTFKEPETHYAAFVPDKRSLRDYADAYERVMELAAALRQQNYYPDDYLEGYKRRK